jgi:MFS family permease
LIAAAAGRRIGRGSRGSPGAGFDVGAALLYAASLAAFLGGAAELGRGWGRAWVPALGAAGLAGFVWREAVSRRPLLDVRLFASGAFAFSNLAALIHYSATFAVGFLLSLYLQTVRGLDARSAGLVLLVQPVLMALLSPPAGRLSDRVEPRFVASVGMGLTALGLALFAGLAADAGLERVVAGLLLIGVGFALFSSPNTNAVMTSVPRESYGVAAATLGTMRTVGQAASLALVGFVLGRIVGDSALGPESIPRLLRAMQVAFGAFVGLCLVGTAASLARGSVR